MPYSVLQCMVRYSSSSVIAHITTIHHFLTLFIASILAPISSSLSITSELPLRMAIIRGVSLSYINNHYNIYNYDVDEDSDNSNGAATNKRQ